MPTVNDIPTHVECPRCNAATSVDSSSPTEVFGHIGVLFPCDNCDELLVINSMDNFKHVDYEET